MKTLIYLCWSIVLSSLLLTSAYAASSSEDSWKINGRLNAYYKIIDIKSNPGGDTSREGTSHNEELNLNLSGPLGAGTAGIETRLRSTDEDNVQQEDVELLYLRSYYRDKKWNVEAGDVALSLNPYVFGGSVKGAKMVYKSAQKDRTWNYSVIGGVKKPSWHDFFRDEDNEPATGYAGAFEAKYIHERSKEIAVSFAALDTDLRDANSDTTTGARGCSIGLNGKWRFNKQITLRWRGAVADGDADVRADEETGVNTALYLKLLTRPVLKSVKSNFVYQRIDSDFVSFGGSANSDKEQIENTTSWTISKQLRARVDLNASRDNLDGDLGSTQNNFYEMATLTYSPDFLKRGDFTFVVSNRDIDGRGAANRRINGSVDVKVGKSSGWKYGGGYQYSDYEDEVTSASSQTTHTVRGLLGYRHKLGKESSYRFTFRPDYQLIEDDQNKIGIKIDAGYVHTKRLSVDLLYLRNQVDLDNGNDSHNSTYQVRTSYKLDAAGKHVLRLQGEKRAVTTENDPASSYIEYIGLISLVSNF